ncbi:MAG: transcriptional regulator, family [Streptosporangiaceae bacterium]|nr:transcriptional regulator, family [Streptosporangiaceae bacterium]
MTTEQSPTVRKLRLGIELRRLRLRSGRTMVEAADHVARTDSSISRMETGQVAVSRRVLDKLCDLYQTGPEEREALLILAGEARQRGWWHVYGDAIPPGFDVRLGLEAEASCLWIYEPAVVPGLLQTEDYARAMMQAEPLPPSDDLVKARISVGMHRQRRLTGDHAPALAVVLHEAVLHHEVGGRAAMAHQLRRLARPAGPGSPDLRVLPFSAGAHPAMHVGGFTLMSVPLAGAETYDTAYVEYRTGSLHLDKPADVDDHKRVFEHLRARAMSPEESRQLIMRLAEAMSG